MNKVPENQRKWLKADPNLGQWNNARALEWLADRGVVTYVDLSAFEIFEVHGNVLFVRLKSEKELKELQNQGKVTTSWLTDHHWEHDGMLAERKSDKKDVVTVVQMNPDSDCLEPSTQIDLVLFQELSKEWKEKQQLKKMVSALSAEECQRALEFLNNL